jgi:hypothetical protein
VFAHTLGEAGVVKRFDIRLDHEVAKGKSDWQQVLIRCEPEPLRILVPVKHPAVKNRANDKVCVAKKFGSVGKRSLRNDESAIGDCSENRLDRLYSWFCRVLPSAPLHGSLR